MGNITNCCNKIWIIVAPDPTFTSLVKEERGMEMKEMKNLTLKKIK